MTLTFDLLTMKSVWESHVTWGTPVQSFVFLGFLVFELEPMYSTSYRQTDRQTDDERRSPLNAPPPTWRGHNKCTERYIPCWWKLTVYYVTWSDSSEHTIPNTLFRSVTHSLWTLVWLVRDCNGIKTYDRNVVARQLFKDLYWHYAYIFIHLYIPQLRFVNCFFTVLMNEWMNELNQHPPPISAPTQPTHQRPVYQLRIIRRGTMFYL